MAAGPAFSQDQPAPPPPRPDPIIAPAWIAQPDAQAIIAARPRGVGSDFASFAVLRCTVADGGALSDCAALREEPTGLGVAEAALSLTGRYRSAKPVGADLLFPVMFNPARALIDQTANGDEGILQRLAAALSRPIRDQPSLTILTCQVADDGGVQACQTAYETHIDPGLAAWQIGQARALRYAGAPRPQPRGYQSIYVVMTDNTDRGAAERINAPLADAFYPAAAKGGVVGAVQLACTVSPAGLAKDCQVRSEQPPGQGFANAALLYAGRSTFLPKHLDGQDVADSLTLDIRLTPGQEGPPDADMPAPAIAVAAPLPDPSPNPPPASSNGSP